MEIGKKVWAIAEGYIPSWSNGPAPQFISHETVCILNAGEQDAHIGITIYFSDKEPVGPYRLIVPAKRTRHFRRCKRRVKRALRANARQERNAKKKGADAPRRESRLS